MRVACLPGFPIQCVFPLHFYQSITLVSVSTGDLSKQLTDRLCLCAVTVCRHCDIVQTVSARQRRLQTNSSLFGDAPAIIYGTLFFWAPSSPPMTPHATGFCLCDGVAQYLAHFTSVLWWRLVPHTWLLTWLDQAHFQFHHQHRQQQRLHSQTDRQTDRQTVDMFVCLSTVAVTQLRQWPSVRPNISSVHGGPVCNRSDYRVIRLTW